MFFYASKLLWLVTAPGNFLMLLLALGLLLGWTRFARRGRWLAGLAALGLLTGSFSPAGALLMRPLEERFPQARADLAPPAGIIVLGGGIDEALTFERNSIALTEAGARMSDAAALARRFPGARLVFAGGTAAFFGSRISESDAARRMWTELGLAPERMEFDDKSRNTAENAELVKQVAQPTPGEVWLLVTSAYHMPRSVGIFRKTGFDVVPFPVDYHTRPWPKTLRPRVQASENLLMLDRAVREWMGLVAYWLAGRTQALFPGP